MPGPAVPKIDSEYLSATVGRMSDGELLAVLGRIADDLDETERRQAALYSLRLRIWTALRRKRGLSQGVVAEASRVTPGAVSFSLSKAEKGRTRRKAS